MPVAALWVQADIDALKTAISGGVKRVVYDGPPKREVEYQDLKEMRALLAEMCSEVSGSTAYRRVKTKRGFRS